METLSHALSSSEGSEQPSIHSSSFKLSKIWELTALSDCSIRLGGEFKYVHFKQQLIYQVKTGDKKLSSAQQDKDCRKAD